MSCRIGAGLIPATCQDYAVGNLTGRFWLINQEDYLQATITEASATSGITAIVPVTPASGEAFAYRFEIPQNAAATSNAFASNDGISGFKHSVTMLVSSLSQTMKMSLASLGNTGRALIIAETLAPKGGVTDSASPPYVLLGKTSGLALESSDIASNDQATGAGITVTLSTPTKSRLELSYPTNVNMTTAAIEALEAVTA